MDNKLLTSDESDQSEELISRRRKRKEGQLEEVRRNALATKRNLRGKQNHLQRPKTSFMKTVHQFAEKRKEIADACPVKGLLLNKSKAEEQQPTTVITKPVQTRGFFRAGVKGKLVSRSHSKQTEESQKLKKAILNNDVLQLLQSGDYNSTKNNHPEPAAKRADKTVPFQIVQSPSKRQLKEGKKYKRKLFDEKNSPKRNQNLQPLQHSSSKSNSENIFFTEYASLKDKTNKSNCEMIGFNPMDPHIVKLRIQIIEIVAKETEHTFWNDDEDPIKKVTADLHKIFVKGYKKFLDKQNEISAKEKSNVANETFDSSSSEIMLDPDSGIGRTLRKTIILQKQRILCKSEITSDRSSNGLDYCESFGVVDSAKNNSSLSRKSLASTERSWQDENRVPLSTMGKADLRGAETGSTIECVEKNRQELVARFISDVNANRECFKEISGSAEGGMVKNGNAHYSNREKMSANDNVAAAHVNYKNSKRIPAILRKSRSLGECIAKEKVLLNCLEDDSKPSGSLNVQFSGVDYKSIPTSNRKTTVDSNLVVDNARSKYLLVKPNYDSQSLRQDVPLAKVHQSKMCSKSTAAAPKMHLFDMPKVNEKPFIITQSCISPIDLRKNFANKRRDLPKLYSSQENSQPENDSFYGSQLSHGDSAQENYCMDQMPSFGDIQERTNRLSLRTSQNQNYCQESSECVDSAQEKFHNSRRHPHHHQRHHDVQHSAYYDRHHCTRDQQNYDSQNYTNPNSQLCSTYKEEVPTPQVFHIPLYPAPSHYSTSPQDSCKFNAYAAYGNHSCPPTNHRDSRQAVKFFAVGENNMSQKRIPVYGMQENSYTHKASNHPGQQYTLVAKPVYSEHVPQRVVPVSSLRYQEHRPMSQGLVGFNYESNGNNYNVSNSNPPRAQMLMNFDDQNPRRKGKNFVLDRTSNHALVTGQNIPTHAIPSRPKYIGQKVLVQNQLLPYSQFVELQPYGHYTTNESPIMNGMYLQDLNNQRIQR